MEKPRFSSRAGLAAARFAVDPSLIGIATNIGQGVDDSWGVSKSPKIYTYACGASVGLPENPLETKESAFTTTREGGTHEYCLGLAKGGTSRTKPLSCPLSRGRSVVERELKTRSIRNAALH